MEAENIFLIVYLIVINILTYYIYSRDKNRAVRNEWRIPEGVLLSMALAGGSVGALCGMYHFHHKTRRLPFVVLVPLFLLLHIAVIVLYIIYG